MKPIGSVTTTMPREQLSKIGMQAGERGLATRESSEIAAWLSKQSPADMDKAAVSRARSHGVGLLVKTEGRYPSGPNGEYLPSYSVAVGCDIDGTTAQREAAVADLRNFLAPPPVRSIEDWLAELSVLTAGRGREGIEAALMVNAYSARLGQYPADVVRWALLEKRWKWFPTWDELAQVCEAKAGPRRHMIAALSKPAPDAQPQHRPATAEERARIQTLVDEMFPAVSQEWRDAAVNEAMRGDCMAKTAKMAKTQEAAE